MEHYLVTYNYDQWNKDNLIGKEECYSLSDVEAFIEQLNCGIIEDNPRNIKVYEVNDVTDKFDTNE